MLCPVYDITSTLLTFLTPALIHLTYCGQGRHLRGATRSSLSLRKDKWHQSRQPRDYLGLLELSHTIPHNRPAQLSRTIPHNPPKPLGVEHRHRYNPTCSKRIVSIFKSSSKSLPKYLRACQPYSHSRQNNALKQIQLPLNGYTKRAAATRGYVASLLAP